MGFIIQFISSCICWLTVGGNVSWVPYNNSVRLYAKLQEAGVPTEFITIDGADHFLGMTEGAMETIESKMLAWAEIYLK